MHTVGWSRKFDEGSKSTSSLWIKTHLLSSYSIDLDTYLPLRLSSHLYQGFRRTVTTARQWHVIEIWHRRLGTPMPRLSQGIELLVLLKIKRGMRHSATLRSLLYIQRPYSTRRLYIRSIEYRTATPSRPFTLNAMAEHATLVKPPPINPSKSAIENVLELTELAAIAPVNISSLTSIMC
jgi:hypothetical protein